LATGLASLFISLLASKVLQAQQLRAPQLALLPRLPQQVQQPLQILFICAI
ncbi:unnamed protein product, partial [Rotaria magnacalcarata]